eukprot:6424116-Amphidinium_carterae.1
METERRNRKMAADGPKAFSEDKEDPSPGGAILCWKWLARGFTALTEDWKVHVLAMERLDGKGQAR